MTEAFTIHIEMPGFVRDSSFWGFDPRTGWLVFLTPTSGEKPVILATPGNSSAETLQALWAEILDNGIPHGAKVEALPHYLTDGGTATIPDHAMLEWEAANEIHSAVLQEALTAIEDSPIT